MTEHRLAIYTRFRRDFPTVAAAQDSLAEVVSDAGDLGERTLRLVTRVTPDSHPTQRYTPSSNNIEWTAQRPDQGK